MLVCVKVISPFPSLLSTWTLSFWFLGGVGRVKCPLDVWVALALLVPFIALVSLLLKKTEVPGHAEGQQIRSRSFCLVSAHASQTPEARSFSSLHQNFSRSWDWFSPPVYEFPT